MNQRHIQPTRANPCPRWRPRRGITVGMLVCGVLLLAPQGIWAAEAPEKAPPAKKTEKPAKKKDPYAWQKMFDGKTLKGWKVPQYGGDGEVAVKDGTIVIGMGVEMTGITWTGKLPTENYEVMLEAKRTKGYDFFATTTFPIGKSSCSFVVGGWAGTVVGLSCVDYYDAADNVTSQFMAFKDNQWYKIRIRVSEKKIECWINDDKMVDLLREEGGKPHRFEVRSECELYCPLGVSTWCTEGVVRNVKIRRLKPEEIEAIAKEAKRPY